MNNLLVKYNDMLKYLSVDENLKSLFCEILEKSIVYINNKYKNKSIKEKIAAVYIIKNLFLNKNKNFEFKNIYKIIDDFFIYIENEYENYNKNLIINLDNFNSDIIFYNNFIKKYF